MSDYCNNDYLYKCDKHYVIFLKPKVVHILCTYIDITKVFVIDNTTETLSLQLCKINLPFYNLNRTMSQDIKRI